MKTYEYGRIKVLATKLQEAGIPQETIDKIMAGGVQIAGNAKPEKKADWMRQAMRRMDALLDPKTRHTVREGCACCLGGKRQMLSKGIAKAGGTLEERVAACNNTPYVFGHSVTLQDDSKIRVQFAPDGQESYRCVCIPKSTEPISITYCYCCGGHIKHHLQTALGRKLSLKVKTTPLATSGKKPCILVFTIHDSP